MVGIWRECEIVDKKRGKKTYAMKLFLLFEDGSLVLANDDVLREIGYRLAYKPMEMPNRWDGRIRDVNEMELFSEIRRTWQEYIEFPQEEVYDLMTLWTIGTYFFHLFESYPYIYIGGAKQTGKSKTLTVLQCLAFNAIFSHNMSTATLYRLIQNARATLLLDETEKLSNPETAREYRSILLGGYKKGSYVYRTEKSTKEKLVPQAFECYAPKALANIGGIEDVLQDRCITITMRRTLNMRVMSNMPREEDPRWQELRNLLYSLFFRNWREVKDVYDKVEKPWALLEFSCIGGISDRVAFLGNDTHNATPPIASNKCNLARNATNYTQGSGDATNATNVTQNIYMAARVFRMLGREWELWRPIMALALFFEMKGVSGLLDRIAKLACNLIEQKWIEDTTTSMDAMLIRALLSLVDGIAKPEWFSVRDIKEALQEAYGGKEEMPDWINNRRIGRAMRRLGFSRKRVKAGSEWLLDPKQVQDLADRMGVLVGSDIQALFQLLQKREERLQEMQPEKEKMQQLELEEQGIGKAETKVRRTYLDISRLELEDQKCINAIIKRLKAAGSAGMKLKNLEWEMMEFGPDRFYSNLAYLFFEGVVFQLADGRVVLSEFLEEVKGGDVSE